MSEDDSAALLLAKQTSITFIGNIVGKILKFSFVIAITRLVTPSTYGIYVLSLSIVRLAQSVSNLGMNNALDYYLPKQLQAGDIDGARSVVFVVSIITVFGGTLLAVILVFISPLFEIFFAERGLSSALSLFALAIPLLALRSVVNALFIAVKRMEYVQVTTNFVLPGVKIVAAVGLVLLSYSVSGLILGHIVALLITLAAAVYIVINDISWVIDRKFKSVPLKNIGSYSFPLVFAGIIYGIVGQIDFFVIGYFGVSAEVGIYRVVYLLAANIIIFHKSLIPILKPMIVEVQDNTDKMTLRYLIATRWVLMMTLPVATTLLILPRTYLSLIFQPEYATAATALVILVVGQVLHVTVGPTGRILEATGKTKITLFNTIVLVVINGFFDILLVPWLGINGAALGTSISLTAVGGLSLFEVWYFWGLHPFHTHLGKSSIMILPAIAGALMLKPISSPFVNSIMIPIVICLLYYFFLRITGSFIEEDVMVAREIDKQIGLPIFETFVQ